MKYFAGFHYGYLLLFMLLFLLSGCTRVEQQAGSAPLQRHTSSKLLTKFNDDERPEKYEPESKHSMSVPKKKDRSKPLFQVVFHKQGLGYAYVARVGDKYRVVHNGKLGKLYNAIDSDILILSPDGQRVAYGAADSDRKYMVVDSHEYGLYSEIGRPVFSPDSKHIAFECKIGPREHLNINGKLSPPAHSFFDYAHFSADSRKIVYSVNNDAGMPEKIIVSDLLFSQMHTKITHGGSLEVNADRTRIITDEKVNGKTRLLEFTFNEPDKVKAGNWYEKIENMRFSESGKSVVFIGFKDNKGFIVLDNKEEQLPEAGYLQPFTVRPDDKGVAVFVINKDVTSAYVYQAFYNDGKEEKPCQEGGDVVYSNDGKQRAYIAIKNDKILIVLNGKDGPPFERVISPRFSPDGKYLVYRAKQSGLRFLVVVDTLSGNILNKHQVYDMVYEPTFSEDGKYVEYGVQHNNELWWKVEKL